jgi:hypothetical protein
MHTDWGEIEKTGIRELRTLTTRMISVINAAV